MINLRFYHNRFSFLKTLPTRARIVDLGCGTGCMQKRLQYIRPDLEYLSVDKGDFSDFFKKNAFWQVDITHEKLPFADNSIDAVFCSHVLEHLASYKLLVSEMRRILKPDGKLYLEVPSLRSVFVPSLRIGRDQDAPLNFYDDPTHIRPYTRQALYLLAREIGFKKIKTGKARNWLYVILSPLIICVSLLKCDRKMLAIAIWSMIGWCNYLWAEQFDK